MSKRILAGVLWFLAAWYAGAWVAFLTGVPDAIAPILGIAAAAFFAGDPLGVIWVRRDAVAQLPAPLAESATDTFAEAA